jgi:hypothetical protein
MLCVCLLLLPAALLAQGVTTATIIGSVMDTKGQALPGANVIAVHVPSGTTFGAASRSDGNFVIPNVRVGGPYTISVTFVGYKKEGRENIFLALAEVRRLDFKLVEEAVEVGAVQVVAERSQVFSEARTGASTNVSTEQIQSLPTIQRSIQDFARLSPQIVGTNIGQSENTGGSRIGGKNARYNNIQVDGAILNDVFGLPESGTPGGQANSQPISLDAIQEFQVSIAPYDVRQGGFTGGLINAITRSGTNQYHGSVYSFGRNQELVGGIPGATGGSKTYLTDFRDLQGGLRFAGPLIQNKLFFFVSGELRRRDDPRDVGFRGSNSPVIFNVPESDMVNIANITKNQYGYDPGTFGKYTGNTEDNKIFARLDYNASSRHRLTLRHNFVDATFDRGVTRDNQSYSLTSQEFVFDNVQHSSVAELTSTFGNNLANEARLSYTRVRDKRTGTSDPFPQVRITVAPSSNVFFGIERSSQANRLDQDIVEFTDNFTYFAKNHTFTLGTHNEFFAFENLFVQDFYGNYEFANIDSFRIGRPSRYRYSYLNPNNPNAQLTAKWDAYQLGFYAQDEWKARSNLNITLGVRVDVPIFADKPARNRTVEASFFNLRTDLIPDKNLLWSPRAGFNWDVSNNRTTQIRGGIGVFSGRSPGVWLSNQYSNTGLDFLRIDVSTRPPNFVADPFKQPRPGQPGVNLSPVATTVINVTDPNFKFPQVFRANVAADRQLPFGLAGTLELIYTENINDILYQDRNIAQATTPLFAFDGRPLFSRRVNSTNFTNVLVLKNTNKGSQYFATAQLQKLLGQGILRDLFGMVAYTYGRARDVNSGTSSVAFSNWQNNLVPGDPNNPPLTTSNWEIRHRIVGSLSYRFSVVQKFGTTVSLFYEGRSGRPFSYTYNGDANSDGSSLNDLVYVPKDANDIILEPNSASDTRTPADIWAELDAFIKADEALNGQRGKIFTRNSAREPWVNQLDLRIAQAIPTISSHNVELTLDILNVLNLVNSDWGKQEYAPFPGYQLLAFRRYDTATGKLVARFTKPVTKFNTDNLLSRWAAQLGIRYSF